MQKENSGPKALFWFRRDLRLEDNCGLHHALKETGAVLPIFIFDRNILDGLEEEDDPRVTFIYREVARMQAQLREWGSDLKVYYGFPEAIFNEISQDFPDLAAIYANRDYEMYAKNRDKAVGASLSAQGIEFKTFKDHVIFEGREIVAANGNPFSVYTPYSRRWREGYNPDVTYPIAPYNKGFFRGERASEAYDMPSLEDMGFRKSHLAFPPKELNPDLLKHYADRRNLPGLDATSHISLHLRFGTVSIREMCRLGAHYSDKWLGELIWRDFYIQILDNYPRIEHASFKKEFDRIRWRNNEEEFAAWCEGRTGYPLVDAGMRQLNQEHWMHNRVRMVTASFLTKHLLVDWRWGEAYFGRKLLDYDLASNVGGWQWATGSGSDAAPYFRVFNPRLQWEKFDPKSEYIRKYVPEFQSPAYQPIVEHEFARKRALDVMGKAVKTKG
jgi:deoxyribodipyrimidine photo-lyase